MIELPVPSSSVGSAASAAPVVTVPAIALPNPNSSAIGRYDPQKSDSADIVVTAHSIATMLTVVPSAIATFDPQRMTICPPSGDPTVDRIWLTARARPISFVDHPHSSLMISGAVRNHEKNPACWIEPPARFAAYRRTRSSDRSSSGSAATRERHSSAVTPATASAPSPSVRADTQPQSPPSASTTIINPRAGGPTT